MAEKPEGVNESEALSGSARSERSSEQTAIDRALEELAEGAHRFARSSIQERVELLQRSMVSTFDAAEAWVADGSRAKRIDVACGEEFLAGPIPTLRNLRLLAGTLRRIERGKGAIHPAQVHTRRDGRVEVEVCPTDAVDRVLFRGFSVRTWMRPGLDAAAVRESAGGIYSGPPSTQGISLVLGAGNVSSIPPMDVLSKLFAEGRVCVLKINPVNEWVGPHVERALSPLVEGGYLRVVYGGADVGRYLVEHPAVNDVHLTGSNHTHDLLVFGPPGPERERRKASRAPLLQKRITSELGNISPVAIVPAKYSPAELRFMAENIAAMVTNNASFNCNAAKLLMTSRRWPQRQALLDGVAEVLAKTPTRFAYYPGAHARYAALTEGRRGLRKFGEASATHLAWALIPDVDPSAEDPIFHTEPFCGVLSETALEALDPAEFLAEATRFMNTRVWGTLNATLMLPPRLERSEEVARALDHALLELRYGTVSINHWPALVYGLTSPPWGAHPSSTLEDIQSGSGFVHNTYLLEGLEKTVLRGPLVVSPKPIWFSNHRNAAKLLRRLLELERAPSWAKLPGVVLAALNT